MFERSVVRVYGPDGLIVGTGFLLGGGLVATCAHVVAQANEGDGYGPPPSRPVVVDFPLVDGAPRASGVIVGWTPIGPDGTGDLAVLELGIVPETAQPARLATATDTWDHDVRILGFPVRRDAGMWVAGRIRGPQATGWTQIEVPSGPVISRGYSGGAVWSQQEHGVVGMVVASENPGTTAYMIPLPALLDLTPEIRAATTPRNPFRGLEQFRETDAAFFHGRSREAAQLAEYVAHRRLVVIAGGSGSGKSSLVRATLIPAVRNQDFDVVEISPASLSAAGDRLEQLFDEKRTSAERVLIFLDQFEEAVAADPAAARTLIAGLVSKLEAVRRVPGKPPSVQVVLTLRSADLDGVFTSEHAGLLRECSIHLLPMGQSDLRDVVVEPVRAAGLIKFETGLPEAIVRDAIEAPGQLPLVEFALTMLWERHQHGVLTHDAYQSIGRVAGALADYADTVYEHHLLTPEDRDRARRLFLQLVRPTESNTFTLHRAGIDGLAPELQTMADLLSRDRLVVIRDGTVALAHEALISQWPRLAAWCRDDREHITWRDRLDTSVRLWTESGEDNGRLLRGRDLAIADGRAAERPADLSAQQRRFLDASKAGRRRGLRRLRTVTAVIAVLALAAGVLAVITQQRNRELASMVRRQAASALAQQSSSLASIDFTGSLQFALAAWRHDPANPEAMSAMMLQHARFDATERIQRSPWAGLKVIAADDSGTKVATQDDTGAVVVWSDLATTHTASAPLGQMPPARGILFSGDGTTLAMLDERGGITAWNIPNRTGPIRLRDAVPLGAQLPPMMPVRFTFSADGRKLAAEIKAVKGEATPDNPDRIEVYDTRTPGAPPVVMVAPRELPWFQLDYVDSVRNTVWVVQNGGTGVKKRNAILDVTTGRLVSTLPSGVISRQGYVVECLPENELVVHGGMPIAERFRKKVSQCNNISGPSFDSSEAFFADFDFSMIDADIELMTLVDLGTGQGYQIQMAPYSSLKRSEVQKVQKPSRPALATVSRDKGEIRLLNATSTLITRYKPAVPKDDLLALGRVRTAVTVNNGRLIYAALASGGLDMIELPGQKRVTGAVVDTLASIRVDGPWPQTATATGRYLVSAWTGIDGLGMSAISMPDFASARKINLRGSAFDRPDNLGAQVSIVPLQGEEVVLQVGDMLQVWNVEKGVPVGDVFSLRGESLSEAEPGIKRARISAWPRHPGKMVAIFSDRAEIWDIAARQKIKSTLTQGQVLIDDITVAESSVDLAIHTTEGIESWNPDADDRVRPALPIGAGKRGVGFTSAGYFVTVPTTSGEVEMWDLAKNRKIGSVNANSGSTEWIIDREVIYGLADEGLLTLDTNQSRWRNELCAKFDVDYTAGDKVVLERIPGADTARPCQIEPT
ncbi:trypsin-like peptidase domain-containing protein [Amycolatopsis sp. lyj-108]|uniref:nSTAND1 domain-containing NTPase n=1 Tax=Amycolatopsis sp. lyj-108 TaxID=2789286 RepID=UPI0039798A4E